MISVSNSPTSSAFPEGFYATTNEPTEVRIDGKWICVERQEMDCGIALDRNAGRAWCAAMADVHLDYIIGRGGTRVLPTVEQGHSFGFMNSTVSSEKPKNLTVRDIAENMRRAAEGHGRIWLWWALPSSIWQSRITELADPPRLRACVISPSGDSRH